MLSTICWVYFWGFGFAAVVDIYFTIDDQKHYGYERASTGDFLTTLEFIFLWPAVLLVFIYNLLNILRETVVGLLAARKLCNKLTK